MAAAPWELRHATDLRTVARELRAMDDKKVLAQFRRELRLAAAPLVPAVRASIGQIPNKTGDQPYRPKGLKAGQAYSSASGTRASLRALLQRATKIYVRTGGRLCGVVIMVDGRKMPSGMRGLPKYEEGTNRRPWAHPVFARGPRPGWTWRPQEPHPYFYRVVDKLGPASRLAVNRALDRITNDITGRPYRNAP